MPCNSGCMPEKCSCTGAVSCIIRIRSLYRGGFEFKISPETTGNECIMQALKSMAIPENSACYFGLQHEWLGEFYWIENDVSIFSQLVSHSLLCTKPGEKRLYTILLRIRFYGIPEFAFDDDTLKNFLFHQLKCDFAAGRLTRNASEVVSLAAYLLHVGSLTLVSHALPGIEFERKLAAVLPKQIICLKSLTPYINLALKIISSLTADQTKMRFIHQCRLLSHYGTEKFAARLISSKTPYIICVSCYGIIIERSHMCSKNIIDWEGIAKLNVKSEVLSIKFSSKLKKRDMMFSFSTPESAKRAYTYALLQQKMSNSWKRPALQFQPLIHVPRSLLQFNGESEKLTEAIKNVFARSLDNIHRKMITPCSRVESPATFGLASPNKPGSYFPYASEANILSRVNSPTFAQFDEPDALSLRSAAEESTFPLIYGSLLAQSTPVLKQPSAVAKPINRSNCVSAMNLPHKKRLAASRPLLNNLATMEQSASAGGLFGSRQSFSQSVEWISKAISKPILNALSHPHLNRRHMSDAGVTSTGDSKLPNSSQLAESDRCFSLVFPQSISSGSSQCSQQQVDIHQKFKSECALTQTHKLVGQSTVCDLSESADDLTALPNKSSFTMPSTLRRRASMSYRVLCLELIQKLHNPQDLEQEFNSLPCLEKEAKGGVVTVDFGIPIRYLVCPSLAVEDLTSEEFWSNASNILVLLDAHKLLGYDSKIQTTSGVMSLFHCNVVNGDHIAVGKELFLSLFSVNRSANCHTLGIHVKFSSTNSPQQHLLKTIWMFCWSGDIGSKNVADFSPFVDEIVATDLSSYNSNNISSITVANSSGSLPLCSLYIVAHVLLRTYRLPNFNGNSNNASSMKSIFDTVSAMRRLLPCTIVSIEEYSFLHELLLRWLEKPPRLI